MPLPLTAREEDEIARRERLLQENNEQALSLERRIEKLRHSIKVAQDDFEMATLPMEEIRRQERAEFDFLQSELASVRERSRTLEQDLPSLLKGLPYQYRPPKKRSLSEQDVDLITRLERESDELQAQVCPLEERVDAVRRSLLPANMLSAIIALFVETRKEERVKLASLENELSSLHRRILGIERQIAFVRNRSSTSQMIPPEILREIFVRCRAEFTTHGQGWMVGKVLSHVSRTWREVALDTSLLWNSFRLTRWTSTELVDTYLGRSGNRPLQMVIYLCLPALLPVTHEEQDIIGPYIHRSTHLSLAFQNPACWQSIASRQFDTHQLQNLRLSMVFDQPMTVSNCLLSGKELEKKMRPMNRTFTLLPSTLPLSLVTHICIFANGGWADFKQFALLVPNLHGLVLHHVYVEDPSVVSPAPAILSSLQELEVGAWTVDKVTAALANIEAPNLRHLSLLLPGKVHKPELSIASFIPSSNYPRVTSLALGWSLGAMHLCRDFPSVESLEIRAQSLDETLHCLMGFYVGLEPPFPRLTTLTHNFVGGGPNAMALISCDALRQCIHKRKAAQCPLRKLRINRSNAMLSLRFRQWLNTQLSVEFFEE